MSAVDHNRHKKDKQELVVLLFRAGFKVIDIPVGSIVEIKVSLPPKSSSNDQVPNVPVPEDSPLEMMKGAGVISPKVLLRLMVNS